MQLELLEITIAGMILIALMLLAVLHLIGIQKGSGRAQKTAGYGFLTFILLFLYFVINWFFVVDISIIVVIYASALTFLPVWVLSLTKPEYLEGWKIPFAMIFLIIWASYVGTRLFTTIFSTPYFLAIVFILSVLILLLGVAENRMSIILLIGLVLVYIQRGFTFFDPLVDYMILVAGLWLILAWYFIDRRGQVD
jgi:hypothetical protein